MKKSRLKRIFSVIMAVAMVATLGVSAFAADVPDATINPEAKGSIDLYKYDITRAMTDDTIAAILTDYESTGVKDAELEAMLSNGTSKNGLGETVNGYAIKGVEFTYLKVADIVTYSENETVDDVIVHRDEVLYKMDDTKSAALLAAIGLTNDDAYPVVADYEEAGFHFFESDTLIDALRNALEANSTDVKDALEAYMAANGGTPMAETNAYGNAKVENLDLGLYLLVETKVPEMVTDTTNPFFVSVPMTSVNGTNAEDGGTRWMYDVTVYPKNETGVPTLEKTVREDKADTGHNNDTDAIDDGFAHNATASEGDVVDYQIVSKLPAITSDATELTVFTYVDTLSKGITYNKTDVRIQIFSDAACTQQIAAWDETSGKFAVAYEAAADDAEKMTISMTADGLAEINNSTIVYADETDILRGYANCYLRVSYSATVNSDATTVLGDNGNPNTVSLTWQRSNMTYFDVLSDDCHVYTYSLDLTKQFSDNNGDATKVNFKLFNDSDKYWVVAEGENGVYYVTDHVAAADMTENEAQATTFVPNADGKLIINGLEDDTFVMTETQTDNGYTLLKDGITVIIEAAEDNTRECGIYAAEIAEALGVTQNDERYADILGADYKELGHFMLTASASIDGKDVPMDAVEGSANARVPFVVMNTRGFDLPATGSTGTWALTILGLMGMAAAVIVIATVSRKKEVAEN